MEMQIPQACGSAALICRFGLQFLDDLQIIGQSTRSRLSRKRSSRQPKQADIEPGQAEAGVTFGPFTLYPGRRLLERDAVPHRIGSRALDLLIMLVERAGTVVSKDDLVARVWPRVIVDESALRTHIRGLRLALGEGREGARYVTNVAGRGYCFVAPLGGSAAPMLAVEASSRIEAMPSRLPSVRRIVGRDGVVKTLAAQVLATRFVSVIGCGGIGKTTVSLAVAHALADDFADAVAFIDLSVLREPGLVPSSVAAALGLRVHRQDCTAALMAHLAGRRALLLFDNCEHVIDAVAVLAERMVGGANQVHILATSREALRVQGETLYQLGSLDVPPSAGRLTVEQARGFSAVSLFLERSAASDAGFTVSDADAATIADVCRRLDGNALAIELAASQVATYGLRGVAKLLDDRFRLAWLGRRTASQRHQTLGALIDWSYGLLSDEERRCFWRLAVLVGDFDVTAAQAIVAERDGRTPTMIERLVSKSLLSVNTERAAPRYRLLETTRAFALDKMTRSGESDAIARRHAAYFADLLERRDIGRSEAEDDLGNVRAALGWAFSPSGDVGLGVRLAAAAAPIFLNLSLLGECHHWCARAIEAQRAAGGEIDKELELREALAIAAMFTRGNGSEVQSAVLRGLELAKAAGDPMSQLRLLAGRHILLTRIANFRGAWEVAEQYDAVAGAMDDESARVTADWMLGIAHHLVGRQAEAQACFESGFATAAGNPDLNTKLFGYDHRIRARVGLSRSLWLRGYPDRALQTARLAIDEAGLLGNPVDECISLIYTAPVFLWRGDWAEASRRIEQLITLAEQHCLAPYHMVGLGFRGELAVKRDQPEPGVALLVRALAALQAEHHHVQEAVFRGALAEGLLQLGRTGAALEMINEAIGQAELSGGAIDQPELLRIKAKILLAISDTNVDQVASLLTAALAQSRDQSSLGFELRAAIDLARLSDASHSLRGERILADTFSRFAEGFDSMDLRAARLCLTAAVR
jgi:predicted ATPase/DNA-binding winged helix-turn-helix (wHTH) protein